MPETVTLDEGEASAAAPSSVHPTPPDVTWQEFSVEFGTAPFVVTWTNGQQFETVA